MGKQIDGEDNDDVVQGTDRISQLPHNIFQHILSFLSQKDAVKTCVLSKPCRYLWSTRPNVEFPASEFRRNGEKFMDVVDRTLQGYHDQNLRIHKFCLAVPGFRYFSLLEKWTTKVVCDLGVHTLELKAGQKRMHPFDLPSEFFKSQSLQNLYLRQCRWTPRNKKSVDENVLFKHLRTLHLKYVIIENGDFERTMWSCPLIERVVLRKCEGLRTINFVNNHNFNLKYFEFTSYYVWDKASCVSIKIHTPSITTIHMKWCPNWIHRHLYYPNLKSLHLNRAIVQDGDFEKIMSSCPLIEHVVLNDCVGLRTINYVNYHNFNLKKFEYEPLEPEGVLDIQIYTPSITTIILWYCDNWIHRHLYYPNLKSLHLSGVRVSEELFDGFSSSFPCLEELKLDCSGFKELIKLSSPSIKHLRIRNREEPFKAAIDAPKIVEFEYVGDPNFATASISFAKTSNRWKSFVKIVSYVGLDFDFSSWLLKMSELLTGLSQSEIMLDLAFLGMHGPEKNADIYDRLVLDKNCCSCGFYNEPVALEHLRFNLLCIYSESSFPPFVDALFRICRPRQIGRHDWYAVVVHWEESEEQNGVTKSLCKILRKGKYECRDDREMSGWQQDLEEVILEVLEAGEEDEEWHGPMQATNWLEDGVWHPVQATNWLEYCDALPENEIWLEKSRALTPSNKSYKLRFILRWC